VGQFLPEKEYVDLCLAWSRYEIGVQLCKRGIDVNLEHEYAQSVTS
jgi:hypothetical protein